MNFSIEVPAEANPLTHQNLFHVLQSASSSDQQQVKTGAQQLHNWEKSPGFYSSLQSLYTDYSLPVELRYLSIIQIKNGIDKYWRKTAANAIKKEEKELIRSRCIDSGINEPDHRLALQISILVAKIIRYEYPYDWPDALDIIVISLRSAAPGPTNPLHLSRTLLILLYVVKELSTAKLQRSRASLQSAAPGIVRALSAVYIEKLKKWTRFFKDKSDDEGGALESIEQSLLALRVLRRLIISGYEFPNRDQEIQTLWQTLNLQFGEMLALVQGGSSIIHANPQHLIEKHLVQISKLHLDMVKTHPAGFALLPDSFKLAKAYWGLICQFGETHGTQAPNPTTAQIGNYGDVDDLEVPIIEKLCLKGLLILRACGKMVHSPAQTFKYQQRQDKEEKKLSQELMKNNLLSGEFAREAMETLVTRFFVFTPRDLRDWEEESDEWEKAQESGGEDWEYSIRTCSEKLFLDLMINYKDLLVQPLLNVFGTVAGLQTTDVMLKDSIYAAIGLAAPVLDQKLDFASWLESTLVQEVQVHQPGYKILRRRIAIVLGQWLPVKEGLNRPLVYQIFQHLLNKDDQMNDQVVRTTAGRQLKNVIDPFEFVAELFVPYAPTIMGRIMALIKEVELPETRMALLNTISVVVVRMERHITPFADQIISLLPPLWDQAGDEHLTKQTILGILAALITSMQAESRNYHQIIIPLIQSSIEPSSETRVYLLEDALDLWATILAQTPSPSPAPGLVSLVQHLFPMYDIASDTLRKALEITEQYIYLIPVELLSNAALLLGPFVVLLGTVKREASGMVTSLVELLIRSADNHGGLSAIKELTPSLLSSGFLSALLLGLHDAYLAHQTTGPKRNIPSIDGIAETDYLNVLARLAVASPSLFISAVGASIQSSHFGANGPFHESIDWLLTEWFSHMDNIGHPAHKKLNCLALTSLLETGEPWILSRLQSLMTVWTDVITEFVIEDEENNGLTPVLRDCLVYRDPESLRGEGPEAPQDERRRILLFKDPVYQIDVRAFIYEKLGIAVERCGGVEEFQRIWVQNVDQDVVSAFGALGVV